MLPVHRRTGASGLSIMEDTKKDTKKDTSSIHSADEQLAQTDIRLLDCNVIQVHFPVNVVIDKELIQKTTARAAQLVNKPTPLLITGERLRYITHDAQQFTLTEEYKQTISAMGIHARTTTGRLLINLYVKTFKPPYPVQAFNDEPSTIQWLVDLQKSIY